MKTILNSAQGSAKPLSNVSEKQLQQIVEDDKRGVPRKDVARIALVPKKIFTDAELRSFIVKVHAAVDNKINTKSKTLALQIYQATKAKYSSVRAVANAACGCWIIGSPEVATWLMGKACIEDTNPDNLNNYAAFLTSTGAQHIALPILMKLNKEFPGNNTILNNIGQAWFGLGDMEQSEKYLDSAIHFFGYHSQANYTKCLIEESKGNTTEAIAALKRSIKLAYSSEKNNKLRKLKGKMTVEDLTWYFNKPPDPLGLEKFLIPEYPKSADERDKLEPQWKKFRDNCRKEKEQLEIKIKKLKTEEDAKGQQRIEEMIDLAYKGVNPVNKVLPPFFTKAVRMMQLQAEGIDGYMGIPKKNLEKGVQVATRISELSMELSKAMKDLSEKYEDRFGEGRDNPDQEYCTQKRKLNTTYLSEANSLLEEVQDERLKYVAKKVNDDAYFGQFMAISETAVEIAKLTAKAEFLNALVSLQVEFAGDGCYATGMGRGKLSDFDEMHCDNHVELNMVIVKMEFDCNKSKMEYDAVFIRGEQVDDLNTGKIISGTAEIGINVGIGNATHIGPIEAGVKAGVGAFVEYGENGITDFGPTAVVKGELGYHFEEGLDPTEVHIGHGGPISVGETPSIEVGVEARWGVNSGGVIKGVGVFNGIVVRQ
jgi:tetratricopeptide (TPR) repeat protein